MDFLGYYMWWIKFVFVMVLVVFGLYVSLNCMFMLLLYKYCVLVLVVGLYGEKEDGGGDSRFRGDFVLVKLVVISSGQQDVGLFELNFKDERYLLFEGVGVISEWKMEFFIVVRQFDYEIIVDVVMQFRYIFWVDDLLKFVVEGVVRVLMGVVGGKSCYVFLDVVNDFLGEWYLFVRWIGGLGKVVMGDMLGWMLFWVWDSRKKVVVSQVYVVIDVRVNEFVIQLLEGKLVMLMS